LVLNAGWVFLQPPVVESGASPMVRWPCQVARVVSSNTWLIPGSSSHLPIHEHAAAVGDGRAGRFLAAVLDA